MATLTIELPPHRTQTEFNMRRWAELLADRELARFEGRIETDRYGHVIMGPASCPNSRKFSIGDRLSAAHVYASWPCLDRMPYLHRRRRQSRRCRMGVA